MRKSDFNRPSDFKIPSASLNLGIEIMNIEDTDNQFDFFEIELPFSERLIEYDRICHIENPITANLCLKLPKHQIIRDRK